MESAVSLTKSLRWEIQSLGQRLAIAANNEDLSKNGNLKAKSKVELDAELKLVTHAIRKLLARIEDAVPLINLAITTSGASLSTSLPATISPSRLLQASTFLTAGDSQYSMFPSGSSQIGPGFTLSMYMLFEGHLRPTNESDVRESTWKEVIHRARVKIIRVPLGGLYNLPGDAEELSISDRNFQDRLDAETKADEFAYQLVLIEDLEDDRVHTFEEDQAQPNPFDDVNVAGIREVIPIHEISKIFYADTGKILNIGSEGEANSPVLLLKRDVNAIPPRRVMDRLDEEANESNQSPRDVKNSLEGHPAASAIPNESTTGETNRLDTWRIPVDLDPEWMAFEVYTEAEESDTDSDTESSKSKPSRASSLDPQLASALSNLQIKGGSRHSSPPSQQLAPENSPSNDSHHIRTALPPIRTSLSLLETLLRLASLQQFQQTSHLSIPDELLNFFLSEAATTGAASGDDQERRRVRNEARRRVGFDPYDESPIKRRGEAYQYRGGESQNGGEGIYASSSGRQAINNGYSSPRYETPRSDERYTTYDAFVPDQINTPSRTPSDRLVPYRPHPSEHHPYPYPSRSPLKPDISSLSLSMSASSGPSPEQILPNNRSGRHQKNLHGGQVAPDRRGSPLVRPATAITDEGLGTSPGSVNLETKKESSGG